VIPFLAILCGAREISGNTYLLACFFGDLKNIETYPIQDVCILPPLPHCKKVLSIPEQVWYLGSCEAFFCSSGKESITSILQHHHPIFERRFFAQANGDMQVPLI
jgi:hypothetical protein